MQSNDKTPDSSGSDTEADTCKSRENKAQSMTKAETFLLLDLVAKSQILHCQSNKSATHELKNQEWKRISKLFNSKTKSSRSVKQLRLKWENLKRFAKRPANREKPWHYDIIVRVLNIITCPNTIDESQIKNKLMSETDNFNEIPEIIISDNLDRSKNDEFTKIENRKKLLSSLIEKKAKLSNKPMTNAETSLLLDLIAKSQVLHCKSGKAAANELKHQEWQRICKLFNSKTKTQRTPKQLNMKWENLKKLGRRHANKSKQYTTPELNDFACQVLKIINNPKPFNANQINIKNYDSTEIDFWCTNTSNKTLELNKIKNREKAKSMNEHESNTLLDLIENSLIFNSSESFSNKVKRMEWCRISNDFNKCKGITVARTPKQLCIRWDNLKRAASRQKYTFRNDILVDRVHAILKNINKSNEQNESDDDDIHSAINKYADTSFSDTEIKIKLEPSDNTESPTNHSINTTDTVKPMSKEETKVLLDLIEESQILQNKVINPCTNEMKIKEWDRITDEFNTKVDTGQRIAEQLRSKWENLKANSRKRMSILKMIGKCPYEASHSILDRVSSILKKFERNASNPSIVNEKDPLDISNELIKVKSEQEVEEDDSVNHKQVMFTRREIKILVTLVRSNKVICNMGKFIYSNKAKQREWRRIARRFNAIASPEVPRKSRQLFIKWENLKRQARKRNAVMKNLQSRNAKHDKTLENVIKPKKREIDKVKGMTNKETKSFIDLIEGNKIISAYKGYNFRVKLVEWQRITKLFNSDESTQTHRTWSQLRLRWENLKRAARKYMATKTEDHYYHPNETLNRVANILQAIDRGNTNNIDSDTLTIHNTDGTPNISLKTEHLDTFLDIVENEIKNSHTVDDLSQSSSKWVFIAEKFCSKVGVRKTAGQMYSDWCILNECVSNMNKNKQMPTQIPEEIRQRVSTMLNKYSTVNKNPVSLEVTIEEPQNMIFKTEVIYEPDEENSDGEKSMEQIQKAADYKKVAKINSYQESRLSRNMAIAEYFTVKKKIAEAKLNRYLLQNEKLKLEIDLLKSREK